MAAVAAVGVVVAALAAAVVEEIVIELRIRDGTDKPHPRTG
jgi:hypothetical protein